MCEDHIARGQPYDAKLPQSRVSSSVHTASFSDDAAARRQMEGLKPEAAKSLAEKEKEFQKRLAKAKTHLPLAAILKGRRAAPQPKEQAKK